MQEKEETWVQSLGWEDTLEKETAMATLRSHSKEMPDGKEMQAPLSDPRVHPAALNTVSSDGTGRRNSKTP